MNKLLIANRGEIAIRIMRTASRMGITTVAIKTALEPAAPYLATATEVYDNTAFTTAVPVFLDVDRIIAIAQEVGADAIHPGYGYLSESAYFAQKCIDQNITFVGPAPDAIYKMGNKTIAKKIARKIGIPMVDGSEGNISDADQAIKIAEKIGYPVIIKAASGGGGRGMRIVRKPEDMERNFNVASNESRKAFNDPSVFIEKYIENPKHIEIQVLGDTHGNVVHLGERECSIQRKSQKLLEEAPSSALDAKLREEIASAAVELAKAVKYFSAGTVEFLLDADKKFYFMEMNTRIQVEHPVTETVTGIDLVEQQIKIARGEKLAFKQSDIKMKGWAIECRINSEDVQSGFVPSTGRIEKLEYPSSKHVRIDSGVTEGTTITTGFDSMIFKLIVSGENRKDAIENCKKALDGLWITGIKTTLPFFRMLLRNEDFVKGNFSTSFVENKLDNFVLADKNEEALAAWVATKLFFEEHFSDDSNLDYEKGKDLGPWLLNRRIGQF